MLMHVYQNFGIFLVVISNLILSETAAFHHVFTGTGAIEVQLIAAKLALKAGDTCTIIGQNDSSQTKKCVALMYGADTAGRYGKEDTEQQLPMPEFASDGNSTGLALSKADSIIIVCEDQGVEDRFIDTLLDNSPKLKKLVLLSTQGGKFRAMENSIRAKCEKLGTNPDSAVVFSVLRAGILVGGGPGGDIEKQDGEEWGLSKYFYDNKFDLSDAMNTMSMDKFTMGVKITTGDPFKAPNFFSKMMASNSFEPRDGDTGRVAAAHALLAAVRKPGDGVDVSISTAKGNRPLSFEEWDTLISRY